MFKWLFVSGITVICLSLDAGYTQNRQADQLRDFESMRYLEQALNIADSLNDAHLKAQSYHLLSAAQRKVNDYPAAAENLYRSLLLSEQLSDFVLMTAVLNDIGEMYQELDNAEEAIYYLEEAKDLSIEQELTEERVRAMINLGIAYREAGDEYRAESYLTEAKTWIPDQDLENQVKIDYNLGVLSLDRGETESARGFFLNSLELSRQRQFSEGIYYSSLGMGDIHRHLGRRGDAQNWYQGALQEARLMNAGYLIEEVLEKIYIEYREAGDMAEALETLESIRHHTDSTRTVEYERSRAEYETRFESRRQSQENQLLTAQRAEQEARIQLQQGLGIGVLIILAILLAVTFIQYGNNRTREKLNRNLQEKNQDISIKNRELDQLNKLKNKMFAIIAHDLRGPLSSLKGLLHLIREKNLSGAALDKLANNLEQSIRDNAATMENLLAWTKTQMSGMNLNFTDFFLLKVVEDVQSQINFQALKKEVLLSAGISSGIRVHGDYDAVNLVIRNLVSNAVKFCESGDTIAVEAQQESGMVTIQIRDTGVGIREEDQEKIFVDDQFTRQGTKNEKGSGLGLSLCKEFVEKHGGRIWFESTPGEGTTFSFTLPAAPEEEVAETEAESDGGQKSGTGKVQKGSENGARKIPDSQIIREVEIPETRQWE